MNTNELNALTKKVCITCIPRLDPAKLMPETTLADLGCDSVSMAEIAMELEDALGKEIPDTQLNTVQTYGDLLKVVHSL